MGSSSPPVKWPSCIPFQGSKVLGEGEERLLLGGYEYEHLVRLLVNGRVDWDSCCKLCREPDCDPCFELTEELDCDHRFWLGNGELDCDDLFWLDNGDSIGESFSWLASSEKLMLEVDERDFLGWQYDHLSGECENLFSSISHEFVLSDPLSKQCMQVDGLGGINGVLQYLVSFTLSTSVWVT